MRRNEAVEPQRMQRTQSSSRRQESLTRERATPKKSPEICASCRRRRRPGVVRRCPGGAPNRTDLSRWERARKLE